MNYDAVAAANPIGADTSTIGGFLTRISILRPRQIFAAIGRPRTCAYRDQKNGLLPKFIKIGARASGLPEHEVQAINAARVAGKSDDEIRALVLKLVAERKARA